jgi:hypothetical protein
LAGDVWIPPFPIAFARRDKVARFPRSIAGNVIFWTKGPAFPVFPWLGKEDGWWVQFFVNLMWIFIGLAAEENKKFPSTFVVVKQQDSSQTHKH